ncbi:MAG TPA: Ig-like domain-containing protein [Bryobacteraceae bacterium]|nr:Ig-like domain-containing protein [Bryobacteraceae bacterium]
MARRFASAFILLLLVSFLAGAQGLSPATPLKEYIRMGGQVVAVENARPQQSYLNIETPAANATYSGVQLLSGWAIDTTAGINKVTLTLDGASFGTALYGVSRPDVCQIYPGYVNCPNVGWQYSLDTTQLPNGNHSLAVTAFTDDSPARQTTKRINFSTSNSNPVLTTPSLVQIDAPSWQSVYSGIVIIGGWAVDNTSAISHVDIAVDGVSYGSAPYGNARPDVCTSHTYPGCPNVGWTTTLDTTWLDDGEHTLSVTAFTADAVPRHTTASITFTTDNFYPGVIWPDIPSGQTLSTLSGQQTISGWAIDTFANIAAVTIAVDGNSLGNATYGSARPDVCSTSDPGCPNVGWSFPLNTAQLTNGYHTLTVTSSTAEESPRQATENISFAVQNANPTAQNTSLVYVDLPQPQTTYTGTKVFSGWAIDNDSAIQSVNVAIDGISHGAATYGVSRPDVCQAYPNRAGCPNVGWNFTFNTATLADGVHTLTVTAVTAGLNPRQTTATIVFFTSNTSQAALLGLPGAMPGKQSFPIWKLLADVEGSFDRHVE